MLKMKGFGRFDNLATYEVVRGHNGQQQNIGTCFASTNREDSLRVHLEVIKAIKLDIDCGLDPCQWGWQRCRDVLKPIKTDLPPAPDFLLHVIRCNCKTTSRNTCDSMLCTCRKNGLKCIPACGDCRGTSCENIEEENIFQSSYDIKDDGNIFEKLFDI